VGSIPAVATAAVFHVGVREIYITPVGSIVALGTLGAVMFGWRFGSVAGDAVGEAAVVEGDLLPVVGVVTAGAEIVVVVTGDIVGMAVETLGVAGVVEGDLLPAGGVVAVGAEAIVMVGRGLAAVAIQAVTAEAAVVDADLLPVGGVVAAAAVFAIVTGRGILEVAVDTVIDGVALVPEVDIGPGLGVVAAAALAGVVVFIGAVTGFAVFETGVVELGERPAAGGEVAGGAGLAIVVGRRGMAFLAVLVANVEEDHILPVVDIDVAVLAFAHVMVIGSFRGVAGDTAIDILMLESDQEPVIGVQVAVEAGGGVEMVRKGSQVGLLGLFLVAGKAFDYSAVVELGGLPVGGIVAVLAETLEVRGVIEVGVGGVFEREIDGEDCVALFDHRLVGMAVFAFGGGAHILTAGMTGQAVGVLVSAIEGIDAVIDILAEEGNGHGIDCGRSGGHGPDGIIRLLLIAVIIEEGGDLALQVADHFAAAFVNRKDHQFGLAEEDIELVEDQDLAGGRKAVGIDQDGGKGAVELDGRSLEAVGVMSLGQAR
ncbi:MAG: hypothetical protein MUP90_16055, partial [Gammaproteobacteria bacterium]|nr:hypothetical protein [Gammaproteobacteria bacterium]